MNLAIPIFVEERPAEPGRAAVFVARPLFRSDPVQRGEKLGRVLARLGEELGKVLRGLADEPRHDVLAGWAFHPELEDRTLELRLDLAAGMEKREFFLVGYPALGRRLWFTPTLPEFRFESGQAESLEERATAALTRYFRELDRDGRLSLDDVALRGRGRVMVVEVEVTPGTRAKARKRGTLAALFGGREATDGEEELRKTGRLLGAAYPDDLGHALGREREVEELARLLAGAERRPVVLVGPRQVGKTAILHEVARRIRERKKERYGGGREIWQLSPARLVSGMSVVGEWENRVTSILDHARDRDRVLYFDDLPGLFLAGTSSASDLNVAQVLRTALERRAVRVVGEITPEGWRVLRERDRAFAELFQVVPVREPVEAETLRVLVHLARMAEEERGCAFGLEVIPTVYELFRRHAGDAAFPGKAAGFLRRLATRHAGKPVTRDDVLGEFQETSGLRLALLDERRALGRAEIEAELARGVRGQPGVVAAFADVLVTLKARLQDPRRPLATFLLLGPTGVGKTQSAKALATFLFGAPERLLRFDLNEYAEPGSAARLTGTVREPEGLLTGAIRRQPFAVVLFDEVEKATPEVFDLLLTLLDEGRLTDAGGRVADFTRAVILLTSNLGVAEARSRLGFGASGEGEDAAYLGAAEKFFRPEFFNRLDRVVPFRTLPKAELEGIGRDALAGLMGRDGLRRRRSVVEVTEGALARLVELGHDPRLGARALKRVLEREVAVPLAARLAAWPVASPVMARLDERAGRFELRLRELRPVARADGWMARLADGDAEPPAARDALGRAVRRALDRLRATLDAAAPVGAVELGAVSEAQARYFAGREQWDRVERAVASWMESPGEPGLAASVGRVPRRPSLKMVTRRDSGANPVLGRQRAADAVRVNLDDLGGDAPGGGATPLVDALRDLAWLEAMLDEPRETRALLVVFRSDHPSLRGMTSEVARAYRFALGQLAGVTARTWHPAGGTRRRGDGPVVEGCWIQGPNVVRLLPAGVFGILAEPGPGEAGLIRIHVQWVGDVAEAEAWWNGRAATMDALEAEEALPLWHRLSGQDVPTWHDHRTGRALDGDDGLRAAVLSCLPMSAEVERWLKGREGGAS